MDQQIKTAEAGLPYFSIAAMAGPILALLTMNPTMGVIGALAAILGVIGAWMCDEPQRWWGTAVGGIFLGMIVYFTFIRADPAEQKASIENAPVLHDLKWHYRHFEDPIRRIEGNYARIDSSTDFELKPPYAGRNNATLVIGLLTKDWAGLLQILFLRGQPLCGYHHRIVVQFDNDDKKLFEMNCTLPTDGTTNTINLQPGTNEYDNRVDDVESKRFIQALHTARQMNIALEFYQSGAQSLTFDLRGLEFDEIQDLGTG